MKELFFDDDTFTADPPARAKSRRASAGWVSLVDQLARQCRPRDAQGPEGRWVRLFVVGYESGNEQILKNIRKG